MSLPLPRPVGVESNDELLTLRAYKSIGAQGHEGRGTTDEARVKDALSEQLPEGFELISVNFAEVRTPYQPRSVTYIFSVRPEFLDNKLKNRMENLMTSESLIIRRPMNEIRSKFKDIDVRMFLRSLELEEGNIVVECGVSETGSVRVQEVMGLLELDEAMLASPVRRTRVRWRDE